MRKDLLIIALGLSLATGAANADVLATPETDAGAAAAPVSLPAKGITMGAVQKQYGEPMRKRAPVGGDSPRHPPITRWDYAAFSVFFEHDRVVDAVIPGAPPRVYNKDQLTPVAASAAPLPPVAPAAELAPPSAEEAAPIIAPAEAETAPEAPAAEAAAAAAPEMATEPETPAEAPPAEEAPAAETPAESAPAEAPAGAYPDAPAQTPAEEAAQDQPPTPK